MGISAGVGNVGTVPVGVVNPFAGSVAPAGWLLCAGQTVSRSTYSGLFSVVGTTYGAGDGSTTFALPDLRGRTIAGLDNMGGSDAGRLSIANTLGTATGAETVTIASANLPVHQHTIDHDHASFAMTTNNSSQVHTHGYLDAAVYLYTGNVDFGYYYQSYYPYTINRTTDINNIAHAHSSTIDVPNFTGSSGNGGFANTALDKMQPTIILNYIIKV
jgi:microcystin-dependent protein